MSPAAPLPDQALEELLRRLPHAATVEEATLRHLTHDASRAVAAGLPRVAVQAGQTSDVQVALEWANRWQVPVSVRGAGTGLAGGAVGYAQGLVLSTARMNKILDLEAGDRFVRVQPGVITADVDRAAGEHGLMYAPDPASHRESTIGGNIATNAGGLRCVRYGVTADHVMALEVVLADGRVVNTGARTRKNVVGYDLTRLFVGSEGTLGVVTEATLRLLPRPVGQPATVRATFSSLEDAGRAVMSIMAGAKVPEVMELMDRTSVELVERHHPGGLGDVGAALLIMQTTGTDAAAGAQHLSALCRAAGAVTVTTAGDDSLLESRRVAGRALNAEGLRISCDVAVPISQLAEVFAGIERLAEREGVLIPTFAHAGDGNLHPSVIVAGGRADAAAHAEHVLHEVAALALSLGGTLSGEHGVGQLKVQYLPEQLSADTHEVHRLIRRSLDPRGILSPARAI